MSNYRPPEQVLSPRRLLTDLKVIYKHRPAVPMAHFDIAIVEWDGKSRLAMRWSCVEDRPLGNPTSSGHPTWFIVPTEFAHVTATRTIELLKTSKTKSAADRVADLERWMRDNP